jgi:hypothetical protein
VTVLTAIEGVLVLCARVVGDLHATSSLIRILKEIHVGAFVKPMVSGLDFS